MSRSPAPISTPERQRLRFSQCRRCATVWISGLLAVFCSTGCAVDRTSLSMDSNSRMPWLGVDLLPARKKQDDRPRSRTIDLRTSQQKSSIQLISGNPPHWNSVELEPRAGSVQPQTTSFGFVSGPFRRTTELEPNRSRPMSVSSATPISTANAAGPRAAVSAPPANETGASPDGSSTAMPAPVTTPWPAPLAQSSRSTGPGPIPLLGNRRAAGMAREPAGPQREVVTQPLPLAEPVDTGTPEPIRADIPRVPFGE